MSLRGEGGGDREDEESLRPAAGGATQQGSNPACPRKCADPGLLGSIIGQSLYQAAVAQASGLSASL